MARNDTNDGRADEALAASARAGDRDAFAELWRRHAGAGILAARQYAHIADADDLLSEASLRIFAALGRGGGPHGAFRPYLYRTIRNIALDWRRPPSVPIEDAPDDELVLPGPELAAVERTIGFRAFRSLPERWQSVLWYLDVEGLDPAAAAPLLGLSPNATSALAARAREGLKKAWLQAHVNQMPPPPECAWTTQRMGEYARGGLTRRGRERFAQHLATCARCTELLDEVEDAGGRLAVLLLPVLLGGSAAATVLARRSSDGSTPRDASPAQALAGGARAPALLVAAAGVLAAVVLAGGVAAALVLSAPHDATVVAESPAPVETPEKPTPTPTAFPAEPTPEPTPTPVVPPRVVPPVVPPVVPVVVPPAVPTAPVIDYDPATGRIAATGTGDEPGATIELWGTTTSLVTNTTSPETLLATAVVAPDGTWATPEAGGLTPINVTVHVRQVNAAGASAPVELIADAIFNAEAVSTAAVVTGQVAEWHLLGWAGAAWELRETGNGPTVASGTFAADGTAIVTLVLPVLPSGTLLLYDYGYVMDGSMAASSPGLTATVP